MPEVAVIDAMEDILRDAGVYDEIKQTLFLAVNSAMKKQKPILKNAKVKEFGSTTDDLLEKLNMKHSLEMFALESGFTSTTELKEGLTDKFGGAFSVSGGPMLHQIMTGAAGEVHVASHGTDEHKQSNESLHQSPPKEEVKSVAHPKKNRSPVALHGSPPSNKTSSSFDLESSYDADEKSTTSVDRLHFSPGKVKKKSGLSPLGPSPPKKSPLASLSDKKGLGGLPPLGNLDALASSSSKRSPLHKLSPHKILSDELSHDSISSSKKKYDHLEDSFDQSLDEKLEESKDGFEISDSFENSDINLKLDSPLSKQSSSHVLAPLGDVLSPYSTKSEREEEKSYTLDDSQPEQLASASFLEESEVSESSNMFDDDECILLDSPKKSDTNPSQINRVKVQELSLKEESESDRDPATTEDNASNQVNVNVSTASTVQMMRSQVGWDHAEDKDRPEDDFEYVETTGAKDSKDTSSVGYVAPGRSGSGNDINQSEEKEVAKVDDYEVNSDFESIEDLDDYADDMKYNEDELLDDEDKAGLNTSHASYRSNQEEDEEENNRLDAKREDTLNNNDKSGASGSLFSSPPRSSKTTDPVESASPRSNKKKPLDDTADYEDDYGDDFDDDFEEEAEEELDESIAESLEEDLEEEDDDQLSFGSKDDDSDADSDKDKSYMSSPSHSPTSKLPSLFTKSKLPEESKDEKSFNDSVESDPFQDKSASFDDDGPETSLASKDDLEDFSVGEESSDNDEFLKDEDDESASATELSVKDQKSVGRLGDSNEFSMSENEISGSHNLNEFADYTTSAAPPAGRRGGW